MGGVCILTYEIIENLFQQHNGIMRTSELLDARIYYKDIQQLMKQGLIAWHMVVSKDSNKSRFKLDYPFVKAYFVESSILQLGAVGATIDG